MVEKQGTRGPAAGAKSGSLHLGAAPSRASEGLGQASPPASSRFAREAQVCHGAGRRGTRPHLCTRLGCARMLRTKPHLHRSSRAPRRAPRPHARSLATHHHTEHRPQPHHKGRAARTQLCTEWRVPASCSSMTTARRRRRRRTSWACTRACAPPATRCASWCPAAVRCMRAARAARSRPSRLPEKSWGGMAGSLAPIGVW